MNKKILLTAAISSIASMSAHADLASAAVSGDFIAGWDFSEVTNTADPVNGYTADLGAQQGVAQLLIDGTFGSSNLGTSGSGFSTNGRAPGVGSFRANNGFDTTGTRNIGDSATGQTSVAFTGETANYTVVFDLGGTYNDLLIEFDWMTDDGASATSFGGLSGDMWDFSFSADGSSYTTYAPNDSGFYNGGYAAFNSDNTWLPATNTGSFGFVDDQTNAVIDLAGESGIRYLAFTVQAPSTASTQVFMDNITVTGVPESSMFGVIAGVAALGFVATRRRR